MQPTDLPPLAARSAARLTPTRTVVWCGLCAVLLAALTLGVQFDAVGALDRAASGALSAFRSPAVVTAFLAITSVGSDGALTGMVLAATALLATSSRARLAPLWLAFLGTEATTYALKYLVGRARPVTIPGVGHALTPSFPSAHSAGTAAVVGVIGLIVAAEQAGAGRRASILVAAGAVALLIGFSRVLLNLHFLSDVLGGFLIAAFWLPIAARMLAREG